MNSAFNQFFTKTALATAVCAGVIYLLQSQTQLLNGFVSFTWYSLFFMLAVTLASFKLLLRGLAMKGNEFFMQYFMAMFGLKIFAALLFVCYFIFIQPISNNHFVLAFFSLYFLFTALLVTEARNILKTK